MERLLLSAAAIIAGLIVTAVGVLALFGASLNALVCGVVLQCGPAWALALAAVSDDSDFAGASGSRSWWLGVLPWTFLLAPLVLPNVAILAAFMRDARADGGGTPLTWDRMRPGDAMAEHHWPE